MFYDLWDVVYGAVIQDDDGSLSNPIKLLHVCGLYKAPRMKSTNSSPLTDPFCRSTATTPSVLMAAIAEDFFQVTGGTLGTGHDEHFRAWSR